MVEPPKKMTIRVFAESLPKNDTTDRLLKIREEQENTRKAKEDALRVTKEKEATEKRRRERENLKDKEKKQALALENARKE